MSAELLLSQNANTDVRTSGGRSASIGVNHLDQNMCMSASTNGNEAGSVIGALRRKWKKNCLACKRSRISLDLLMTPPSHLKVTFLVQHLTISRKTSLTLLWVIRHPRRFIVVVRAPAAHLNHVCRVANAVRDGVLNVDPVRQACLLRSYRLEDSTMIILRVTQVIQARGPQPTAHLFPPVLRAVMRSAVMHHLSHHLETR